MGWDCKDDEVASKPGSAAANEATWFHFIHQWDIVRPWGVFFGQDVNRSPSHDRQSYCGEELA